MRVATNGRGSWYSAAPQGRGNQGESPEEAAAEEGLRVRGIPRHSKAFIFPDIWSRVCLDHFVWDTDSYHRTQKPSPGSSDQKLQVVGEQT